ncbi:MAG: Fic family protein [Desulfuromusa sp.]|nr:Fic family protein [Desulfuromusa sp.]
MSNYAPPFEITPKITDLLVKIGGELVRLEGSTGSSLTPHLRRGNRIRTIQASLAIEQNTLTIEQVTAVIEGKTVAGLPHEIKEVQNAFTAYEQLEQFDSCSSADLLNAHRLLMTGLVESSGKWRTGGVGVIKGKEVIHMAPPAENVSGLMNDLLTWLQQTDTHPLIASCVFHYELEFIHPFADGNGRMGRLWQSVILSHWNSAFNWIPVETIIRDRQQEYYTVLAICDKTGTSTRFIEFMLHAILDSCGGVNGGVNGGVKSLDEQILTLLNTSEEALRANQIAVEINSSKRSVERALQRLKQESRISFSGAPKTGGYVPIAGAKF